MNPRVGRPDPPEFEPMIPAPRMPVSAPEVPLSLQYPFWNYEDVTLFFGMGIPCLVLSVVLLEAISGLLPAPLPKAMYLLSAQFIGYGLWFASLVLLLRVRYDAPFWDSLAWVMPKTGYWRAVFQGPMLAFAVAWIGYVIQMPSGNAPIQQLMGDRFSLMLTGIFGVTIAPLCEELAFRGFLMPLVVRSLGPWPGVFITALPFALLHGPQYGWSWRHVAVLILAGMAFGRVRHITGSTAAAVMTHATYNLTFFTALLVNQGKG